MTVRGRSGPCRPLRDGEGAGGGHCDGDGDGGDDRTEE